MSYSPPTLLAAREPPIQAALLSFAGLLGSLRPASDPLFMTCTALIYCCLNTRLWLAWTTIQFFANLISVPIRITTLIKASCHPRPVNSWETGAKSLPDPLGLVLHRSIGGGRGSHRGSEEGAHALNWTDILAYWLVLSWVPSLSGRSSYDQN